MKETVNKNMLPNQSTVRRSIWQAWILLALELIAATAAAFYVRIKVEGIGNREFDFACNEIRLKIDTRLNAHVQILQSGAALFDASDEVTREKWHTFVMSQRLEQQFPGIQGMGFSLLIPREQLSQHIQKIRNGGFPEYNVKPEGFRETYTSIIYLEPFSGRNLRAFGYDMFSEPIRRAAMERSRNNDSAALSGKVILVQETDKDVQPGTLMYVPIYRRGMPTDTIEQRRAALYGWVYSPYRMNDLMKGILGGWDFQEEKRIRLQVFDGEQSALLYDSQPDKKSDSLLKYSLSLPINFAGRNWTLRFFRKDGYTDYTGVWLVMSGGIVISLLLFLLALSLFNTRFRSKQIADILTANLRESEERYKKLSDLTFEGILFHKDGIIIDCNQSFVNLMGYTQEGLIGKDSVGLLIPEKYRTIVRQNIADKIAEAYEVELAKKNGLLIPVEIHAGDIVYKGREMRVAAIRDISRRKKAEMELDKIFTLSSDMICIADINGCFRKINPAWEKTLGYSTKELLSKPYIDFVHPDDKEKTLAVGYEKLASGVSVFDFENRYLSKDGTYKWLLWTSNPDVEKGITYAIAHDITNRKQAEEQLQNSEIFLNTVFEENPYSMWISDDKGTLIRINKTCCNLLNINEKEVVGKYNLLNDNIVEEQGFMPLVKKVFDQGEVVRFELQYDSSRLKRVTLENTKTVFLDVTIFPINDSTGKIKNAVIQHVDITERKTAEKAVSDAALYTRSLIEASLDPLVTISADGKITDVNKATESVTGYSREQLIGSNFADYFTEPEKAEAGYSKVFKTGSVSDYELHIRHKDGKITPVLYNASVYRDESGNIIGVFAAARDISARKRLEEEQLRLERKLLNVKKFESLIRASAGISHNLNNILMSVMGYTEMAMDDTAPESPIRRNLENAMKSVRRAAEMTHKILAYSGSGFFTFKEISINRLIQENISAFRSAMSETVSFSPDLTEDIPPINADSEQIKNVIINILVNSSEAIGENAGTVILSSGVKYCDDAYLNQSHIDEKPAAGRFVYIEISDTGCGMNGEAEKLLFDPFFTTKFMGRGLGMSAVLGTVRSHKGAIFVKSELGRGTTVSVLFPVSESVPKITEHKAVRQEISQPDPLRKTVFVVDDEEDIRDICDMMLNNLGYRTLMAADGDEAVDIFRENAGNIHCVLLDLTMPKTDGISALKEMRRIRPDIKVIISSGHSKEEISERFGDYGFAGILQKPFEFEKFKKELEAVMDAEL